MASKIDKKSGHGKKKKRSQTLKRFKVDSVCDQWGEFVKGLSKSSRQEFPQRVFKNEKTIVNKDPVQLWGFSSDTLSEETNELAAQCHRVATDGKITGRSEFHAMLEKLASTSGAGNLSLNFAVQLLSACAAFPKLAGELPEAVGQQLFRLFHDVVSSDTKLDPKTSPLEFQLLFGELPILMAITFPEVASFPELMDDGIQTLRRSVDESLDGNGLPHATLLPHFVPLTACLIRSKAMCDFAGAKMFVGKQLSQFSHVIEQLFRLMRKDGTCVFGSHEHITCSHAMFAAALQIDDDKTNPLIAVTLLNEFAKSSKKKRHPLLLPEPSDHSEWAEVAVLQADWTRGFPKLTTEWSNRQTSIELNCNSTIFSGEWGLQIELDGKSLKTETDWSVACWFSDDDCDFLELEIEFEQGLVVQRQILLGRNDHFLYLADVVLGKTDAEISYRATLPLSVANSWEAEKETNEGHILGGKGNKRIAAVMPLAMPEWRTERSTTKLAVDDNMLVYSSNQERAGCFPLFIDLDTQRIKQPLTWRRLTVAEQLRIVKPYEAAGFRVQSGDSQWLFYRSLTEQRNRTLLGQNLVNEFFVGEFDSDGETNEIVSID